MRARTRARLTSCPGVCTRCSRRVYTLEERRPPAQSEGTRSRQQGCFPTCNAASLDRAPRPLPAAFARKVGSQGRGMNAALQSGPEDRWVSHGSFLGNMNSTGQGSAKHKCLCTVSSRHGKGASQLRKPWTRGPDAKETFPFSPCCWAFLSSAPWPQETDLLAARNSWPPSLLSPRGTSHPQPRPAPAEEPQGGEEAGVLTVSSPGGWAERPDSASRAQAVQAEGYGSHPLSSASKRETPSLLPPLGPDPSRNRRAAALAGTASLRRGAECTGLRAPITELKDRFKPLVPTCEGEAS